LLQLCELVRRDAHASVAVCGRRLAFVTRGMPGLVYAVLASVGGVSTATRGISGAAVAVGGEPDLCLRALGRVGAHLAVARELVDARRRNVRILDRQAGAGRGQLL